MHYVCLTDNVVTDQAQVDPFSIFYPGYASQFIEAPDEVTFGWKLENGQWVAPPPPPPGPTPQELNKEQAESLLKNTDWVELGDVSDPTNPPYLTNKAEFTAYRAALRAIAVNPPVTVTEWPVKPDEVWSDV